MTGDQTSDRHEKISQFLKCRLSTWIIKFLDYDHFGTRIGQLVNKMNEKCMMYHCDDVSSRKIHEKVNISDDV